MKICITNALYSFGINKACTEAGKNPGRDSRKSHAELGSASFKSFNTGGYKYFNTQNKINARRLDALDGRFNHAAGALTCAAAQINMQKSAFNYSRFPLTFSGAPKVNLENELSDEEFEKMKEYMLESAVFSIKGYMYPYKEDLIKDAEDKISELTQKNFLSFANQSFSILNEQPLTLRQIYQAILKQHECIEKIKEMPKEVQELAAAFPITPFNTQIVLNVLSSPKILENDELFELARNITGSAQTPKTASYAEKLIQMITQEEDIKPAKMAAFMIYEGNSDIPETAVKSLNNLIEKNNWTLSDVFALAEQKHAVFGRIDIKRLQKVLEESAFEYIFENAPIQIQSLRTISLNPLNGSSLGQPSSSFIKMNDLCRLSDDEISKLGRIIQNKKIQQHISSGKISASNILRLAQLSGKALPNLDALIEKTDSFCVNYARGGFERERFISDAYVSVMTVLSKCSEAVLLKLLKISLLDAGIFERLSMLPDEILYRKKLIDKMSGELCIHNRAIDGLAAISKIENPNVKNQFLEAAEENTFVLDTFNAVSDITCDINIIKKTAEKLKNGLPADIIKALCEFYKYKDADISSLPAQERLNLYTSINNLQKRVQNTSRAAAANSKSPAQRLTLLISQKRLIKKAAANSIFNSQEMEEINRFQAAVSRSLQRTITPSFVSKDAVKAMMSGFFANSNAELEKFIAEFDFAQFGKNGIPLAYPRQTFLEDLTRLMKNASEKQREEIFKKLEISAVKDERGNITGYDGVINLRALSQNSLEGKVLAAAKKFIEENRADTGNEQLDNLINSLIQGMPEFINIIGKKQHETQQLSVDTHILKVLSEALKHPEYKNLPMIDRTCLKFAAIMHDIAKKEGIIDEEHPGISALYARNILEKYPFPASVKDRIYELVKNHHWLEEYSNGMTAEKTAVLFRHKNDFEIAKILAEADLKGVSSDFYAQHADALEESRLEAVKRAADNINKSGQIIFTSKIIRDNLIPRIEHGGRIYKVINFASMPDNEDLSKYGFAPGETKKSARFYVHAANSAEDLETVYALSDIANGGFLCASYISPEKCETYFGLKYGVSLECENVNIANASNQNQGSGGHKNFQRFADILTGADSFSEYRISIPNAVKTALNLTGEEYAQFCRMFSEKEYITQIRDDLTYKIGNKTFSGSEIKQALRAAAESLISDRQNESNLYNPKINAFIAKAGSIEEIPQEFLDFIQKHNLPVYLLGRQEEKSFFSR